MSSLAGLKLIIEQQRDESYTSVMSELDKDIAAFDEMRNSLEAHHMQKWVVFYSSRLVGVHDSFDAAAIDASRRFGRGPYLIRQVGAPPVTLPASAAYFQTANALH
jgi:hypothetical protein